MKTIIMAFVLCLIMIYSIMTQNSISSRSIRAGEVQISLRTALAQTVKAGMQGEETAYADNEEMIAAFNRNLLLQLSSDAEVEVQILEADYEQGLLDVNVIERFTYPNGKEGEVSCRKSVIYIRKDAYGREAYDSGEAQ